jgi:hypothetical protein
MAAASLTGDAAATFIVLRSIRDIVVDHPHVLARAATRASPRNHPWPVTNLDRIPPDATVSGGNILSMLAAMGPFRRRGEQILGEHGIQEVTPEAWYPLRPYVDSLLMIGQKMGPNTLFQIGRQIPNHVPLPPGIDTFEKVMASFGMAYDMNHRGVKQGVIPFSITDSRHGTITTGTPYPCDFDRGVIQGFFTKLLSTRPTVNPVEGLPCKARGGETCTYEIILPQI